MAKTVWTAAAAFVLAVFMAGCTDTPVEIVSDTELPAVDDQLLIRGQVCTDPPDNSDFPVKIMFIIDSSGSMQQTDEGMQRVEAVQQVVRRFANSPNVSFNIIKFNGRVAVLTNGFQHLTGDEGQIFGPQGLQEADSMTDYQGALGVAYQQLLADMNQVAMGSGGLPELGRTKYVIIFFSDGTPDPVCYGCVPDPPTHPRYNVNCSEDLHVVCTLNDNFVLDSDALASMLGGQVGQRAFLPYLEEGTDYNHNYQIFQLVDAIMDLKDTFHVGEMRFHTAFLYCRDQFGNPTSALCEAAEQAYNLDPDRGRALLREMARRGNGTFRDFTSGQDINFLQIDYTSIKRAHGMKNLLVTNRNALPGSVAFLADSDGDGLDDDTEMRAGTDPLSPDTDGDFYGDLIEIRNTSAGFDPLDPSMPDTPCSAQQDSDGDGLLRCEEDYIGTDDKLVDSDADGYPDGVEFKHGTDPLADDGSGDLDADGITNSRELLFHTNPTRSDPVLWQDRRYWYETWPLEEPVPGQLGTCYGFQIRHLSLVTTRDRNGPGSMGYNDILLWFDEASLDDPLDTGRFKVACVRVQYIEPDYKIPLDGEMELEVEDFVRPTALDLSFGSGNCVTPQDD